MAERSYGKTGKVQHTVECSKKCVNDSEGIYPALYMKNMATLKASPTIAMAKVRPACDAALVGEGVGPSVVPVPVEPSLPDSVPFGSADGLTVPSLKVSGRRQFKKVSALDPPCPMRVTKMGQILVAAAVHNVSFPGAAGSVPCW